MHEIEEVIEAFEAHRRALNPRFTDEEGPTLLLAIFGIA